MKFFTNIKRNWQTSLLGMGSLVVAGGATINGAPVSMELIATLVQGIGLLFASDMKKA